MIETELFNINRSLDWSTYLQIGAYDCASETISTTEICQDKKYPQWRIYCPLTNTTTLAFPSEQRTEQTKAEEIFIWILEKINELADQCYGKSWPVQHRIESIEKEHCISSIISTFSRPKTIADLDTIIPKTVNQFQLFVSDDPLLYTLVSFRSFLQ